MIKTMGRLLIGFCVFLAFAGTRDSFANPTASMLAEIEAEHEAIFRKVSPAVVFISNDQGFGSGFFVTKNGLILTNRHVVAKAKKVNVVLQDGRAVSGQVIDRGKNVDLATVKVDLQNTPFLKESQRDTLQIGMFVASVGHGRGAIWTYNSGLVSNIYSHKANESVFQTQIPLNPGSSGGPVVDRHGEVVGIVTAGMSKSNSINFAIRIKLALASLPSLSHLCNCLIVTTPGEQAIFVDGEMAGKGPRLGIRPGTGEHEVFAVIDGKMVKRVIRFPKVKSVALKN